MKKKIIIALLSIILLKGSAISQILQPELNKNYYIIHSSGNIIAENNSGVNIQTVTGNSNQFLQFIPDGAGYYSIKLVNQNLFITQTGEWNTTFGTNPNVDAAKFSFEQASNIYIRIRCKINGKYLGTDNTTAGSTVFSDKSGTDSKHNWYISEKYTEPEIDTVRYNINPNAAYDKPFEGWGVSLCWWANMCGNWTDDKIDEIVDWLVSPEGLNYNIFRYNIGGGDDPLNRNCDPHHMANGKGIRAEMEGFKDGTNSGYNWSRDAAQRKIMLKIKEKRPDAIFEAFSNSAPYYMTYSGCVAGNVDASKDNLRPEYYNEFAHYLVDVCKHYKDVYGIEFKSLDPFNEPVTSYWGANGGQEGCHFGVNSQIEFIKILRPVLQQSGLQTVISVADETSVAQTVTDIRSYANAGILNYVGQWNTHTYSADNKSRANVRSQSTFYNSPLWMSEVGSGGTGISGNLNLAQKLMNDIRYLRPEAWIDWQYMEEANDQWCTVRGSFSTQTYSRVKNYYVRQQLSKYIRKNSRFLFVPNEQMLAALCPTNDTLIIGILNNSSAKVCHKIDLSQFTSFNNAVIATRTSESENNVFVSDFSIEENFLSVDIPGYSITTLMVPIVKKEIHKELQTDAPYLILSRSANLVVQSVDAGLKINSFTNNSTSQIWKLSQVSNGFTITNLDGDIITDNGDYLAVTAADNQNGQIFQLESIGDDCYKIVSSRTGKALDLQGESNAVGTNIGFYDYGTDPAAAHRQWLLYALPQEQKTYDQVLHLSEGWNLISIAVLADNMNIAYLFPNAQMVKNSTAFFDARQNAYLQSLSEMETGAGYLVYNKFSETITITGSVTTQGLAALQNGWNLTGCPYIIPTSFETALESELQNVEVIKNFEGFYEPGNTLNSIEHFEPGKAYYILK